MTISSARRVASRMQTIGTESAFEVSARARALEAQGRPIIHLQIGEPDFDTPANVREAAKRALDEGATHYAPFPGIPALREAIAADVDRAKGLRGRSVAGLRHRRRQGRDALRDPRPGRSRATRCIVPDPGYPIYESLTRFVGAHAGPDPDPDGERLPARRRRAGLADHAADAAADHQLAGQPDRRRADPRRPRARSPSSRIRHDLWVLTDEIYGRILYDGEEHVSIASLPGMAERTIVLDGFSKTFAMTGWRLGYAIVPTRSSRRTASWSSTRSACAPTFAQVGAVEALRGPQDDVEAMVVEFKARRDLIVDGLNAIPGIRCRRRSGAFYVVPRRSAAPGLTGAEMADRLLQEAGVCVARRDGVRRRRRRPHPDLVRELAREPDRGPRRGSGRSSSRSSADAARGRRGEATRPPRSSSRGSSPTRGSTPSARRATRTSGRTSSRRRGTSCCERSRAATAS